MTRKHILLHSAPAWGHIRPMIALAVRIAKLRPDVTSTILVDGTMFPKCVNELERWVSAMNDTQLLQRVRIVDFYGDFVADSPFASPTEPFRKVVATIKAQQPLECTTSHRTFTDVSTFSLAILDPFAKWAYDEFERSMPDVPIIMWGSAPVIPILRMYGPPGVGVLPGIEAAAVAAAARGEGDVEAIGEKLFTATDGSLVELPGCPPLYDYELQPQKVNIPFFPLTRRGIGSIDRSAASFYISSPHYEREALEFAEQVTKKPTYAIGPLLAPPQATPKDDATGSLNFLDQMKEKHGMKSVLYISFGSFFFPNNAEVLTAVLETLAENKIPFVLVHQPHAPPLSFVPSSGADILILKEWAPQDAILAHPATSWFLSHGGWNSLQESFAARIPLILWPQAADQPINAALLTRKHHAAFELYSVRSGAGASGPPYAVPGQKYTIEAIREEVNLLCSKMKGEEGVKVKDNLGKLASLLDQAWEANGPATKALEDMLTRFVDEA